MFNKHKKHSTLLSITHSKLKHNRTTLFTLSKRYWFPLLLISMLAKALVSEQVIHSAHMSRRWCTISRSERREYQHAIGTVNMPISLWLPNPAHRKQSVQDALCVSTVEYDTDKNTIIIGELFTAPKNVLSAHYMLKEEKSYRHIIQNILYRIFKIT